MFNIEFLKNLNVLYVEDEQLAREKLTKLLNKLFNNVITSENGLEGYEAFLKASQNDQNIDLIISDINMPIMNGLEMIEKIREINAEVPVIYTTARTESENLLKAVDLNVSHYVIKPIDTQDLIVRISEICEKKYIQSLLEEKQKELKIYLNAIDHVVLIYKMDVEGNILFANKSFLETSEYSMEELEALNFENLIHPDIPKKFIDATWEELKLGKIWEGNTKFISKSKEVFYLQTTIFKIDHLEKDEYITIGFLTTKENLEKREFQKKVIKNIQEFNKKESSYKKLIIELNSKVIQYEKYIPRLQEELAEEKNKTLSKQRQLEHYEMQMHNVDEKYHGFMNTKSKELDEYVRNINSLKQEKATLNEKTKEALEEVEATKKELKLLMEMNEHKIKRINELEDVIKSLEAKIKELTTTL